MTTQRDAARGRDVLARWCDLAEARLGYLTELFETGRWRRYHTERSFLENIQEAKIAVETWRDLSTREGSRNNSAIDVSWLGHNPAILPGETPRVQPMWSEPPTPEVLTTAEAESVFSGQARSAQELEVPDLHAPVVGPGPDDMSELTRGIAAAVAERYPQLRSVM